MKSFEDYYWTQFDVLNKDTQLARQFGQDVWDYKQKEIDNLKRLMNEAVKAAVNQKQTEIDELQKTTTGWKDECRSMTLRYERLQKRIDEALNFYNIAKSDVNIGMIKMAAYLKGNQNE